MDPHSIPALVNITAHFLVDAIEHSRSKYGTKKEMEYFTTLILGRLGTDDFVQHEIRRFENKYLGRNLTLANMIAWAMLSSVNDETLMIDVDCTQFIRDVWATILTKLSADKLLHSAQLIIDVKCYIELYIYVRYVNLKAGCVFFN